MCFNVTFVGLGKKKPTLIFRGGAFRRNRHCREIEFWTFETLHFRLSELLICGFPDFRFLKFPASIFLGIPIFRIFVFLRLRFSIFRFSILDFEIFTFSNLHFQILDFPISGFSFFEFLKFGFVFFDFRISKRNFRHRRISARKTIHRKHISDFRNVEKTIV